MKTQFQGINKQTWRLTWQEKVNDHQYQQICNKKLRTHNCLNYKIIFHFPCSFVLKFIMDKMYRLWHHIIICTSSKKNGLVIPFHQKNGNFHNHAPLCQKHQICMWPTIICECNKYCQGLYHLQPTKEHTNIGIHIFHMWHNYEIAFEMIMNIN
jgi:hypothetical protein